MGWSQGFLRLLKTAPKHRALVSGGINRNVIAALAATTILVVGCSGAPEVQHVTVTETVEAPETKAPEPKQPAQQADAAAAGEAEHAEKQGGIPGAPLSYPGAGGPVPDNARPIRTLKSIGDSPVRNALFVTPSGIIGCMMNLADEPMFDCGVKSFMESEQFGIGELGTPKWMMEILGGYPREQTEPPLYDDSVWPPGSESAEVVQYGEVVNHGPFVCAVEETGVTCWDSESGKGAWLERDEVVFF